MARPTLKQGMKGDKGTELGDAIFLWRVYVGLPPAKNVTSFDYGNLTVEKTKAFQRKWDLEVNGEVGPDVWAKYDELQYGPPAPASAAAQKAADKIAAKQEPPSEAAQQAAANISSKKGKATPAPTTPGTPSTKFLSVPKSMKEAKTQVVHHLNQTPLWLRIVGGAVGFGVSALGLKKLFQHKH